MHPDLERTKQVNNVMETQTQTYEEIDLSEIVKAIWQGRWIVVMTTILFALASVIYALNQPNVYSSQVLLAPAEQEQKDGLRALAGQFGGLASLAGVSLGGTGGFDKTQMALAVLKSRQFTSEFIEKHDILPDLMAAESWCRDSNSVSYNQDLYNEKEKMWVREVEAPFTPKPSMQEAYKEFEKIVTVNTSEETGLVTISVEHISPYVAKRWVDLVVQDINTAMKDQDVIEANKSAEFLTQQIQQTKISDIRTVLYRLVEEQTKTIMFANVRDEYVFKTIDPAFVPEEKVKPKRVLIVALGVVLGGILSVLIVLIRYFINKNQ